MGNVPLSRVDCIKYLGIMLDQNLSFIPHVDYISTKCKSIYQLLRRHTYRNWRNIHRFQDSLETIYQRAILPILAYGVEVWGHRLSHVAIKAEIRNTQAFCLRLILGIYSSTPCETACVLSRCPPLHLHLQYTLACRSIKTGGRAWLFGNEISIVNFRFKIEMDRHLLDLLMRTWQIEWTNFPKGSGPEKSYLRFSLG
ncbi:hypothetical protein JTB14_007117 [Gonioctena quinquepunctata]|nr:hypothetical protein JTB14_007117 [Gonioctena quinquepunctata]